MEWFRIANFIMQAVCVILHLVFIIGFLRRRQPTPIWRWFVIVTVGLWMLISGRFMESIAYLFIPSNAFYTFSVYWQFVGTTYATFSYLFWNLHLAGFEKVAKNKVFRIVTFAVSTAFCIVICTNIPFHLFYKKLVMGEQVVHGPAHTPWIVWVYGMLFVGYVISVIGIIRSGKEKVKRIIVFSLFPLFPAIAALVRSVTGVDELDATPLVVAVSVFCMYLIVFKRNYVNVIPQSIESALEQTESGLALYDRGARKLVYLNRAAKVYENELTGIFNSAADLSDSFDYTVRDKIFRMRFSPFNNDGMTLLTMTDVTDLLRQKTALEAEIKERDEAVKELEDKRRNIEAYLDSLYQIPDLKEKQALISETERDVLAAFEEISVKLQKAEEDLPSSQPLLNDNMELAGNTLAQVRTAVSKLKEGL